MIPGTIDIPHPGDGAYNFAGFPEIEIDFVLGQALVGGVSTPITDLIGGPDFVPARLSARGLEVGTGYAPDSFPQAIGLLFNALRDGLVAGCTIVIEWASTLDEGSGFEQTLFSMRVGAANATPNYQYAELEAAGGDQYLRLAHWDLPLLRGSPTWHTQLALSNSGLPQKAVVQLSRLNPSTGQYIFGIAANGSGFAQVVRTVPQLPELLYEFSFNGLAEFAEAQYSTNPKKLIRKFKVMAATAVQNLTQLSSFTDIHWPYVRALLGGGAADESPQLRGNVTLHGTALRAAVAGAFNTEAYVFDGSGARVSLPADIWWNSGSLKWTIAARVRWTSNSGVRHLAGKANILALAQGSASTLELRLAGAVKISAAYTPPLNTWVWVAADWDETTYRLYVNGAVVGSATGLVSIGADPQDDVTLGAKPDGTAGFDGAIEEFQYTYTVARYGGAYVALNAAFSRERFASMENYDPGTIPEGVIAASLVPLVSGVSGTHGVVAAGSVVLAPLQSMLSGDHGVAGNGAAVLAPLQVLVIEDTSNITSVLAPLAVAITTAHGVAGLASVSLAALAVSADGLHGVSGSVNATLAAFAASLVGEHGVAGSGTATLAPIVASVTGTFGDFVTWSPVKSSPSMTLSNSDKTATCTVASRSAIATSPILSNAYWEVECLSGGSGSWLLGACLGSSYAAGTLNALPEGLQYNSSGGGGAPLNVSYTVGDVIGFAFNPATAQLWVRKNGTWLGSDPAGAAAFTFNPGRIYYPSFSSTNTRAVTIRVLSGEWGSAAPSGYGELSSGNAPAFAWNPSDKNANLALSASNTIATKSSTGAASARMGTDFCSGKQVFAVQLVADGAGAGLRAVGINDFDDSLSGISGFAGSSVGYRSSGVVLQNNSTLQTYASWGTVGDILMIATEHASSKNAVGKVWFGLNGTWNGDPAAGTGSVGVWPDTGVNRIAFITCGMTDAGDAMQMIPWPYAVPSGFTAPSIAT
jgi:hypothetical protein